MCTRIRRSIHGDGRGHWELGVRKEERERSERERERERERESRSWTVHNATFLYHKDLCVWYTVNRS